jgi:hypothetical protein
MISIDIDFGKLDTPKPAQQMIPISRLFSTCLLIIPIIIGCTTTQLNSLVDTAASLAGSTARIATIADLASNPSHRPMLEAGVIALDGLLRSTNYTSAKFQEVLRKLPIWTTESGSDGIYGTDGAIYQFSIGGGVAVIDLVANVAFDVQSAPALSRIMTSVRNGISEGLSSGTRNVTSRTISRAKPNPTRITRL